MGIYEGEEEVLVITNYHCSCLTGGIDRIYRVKRSSAIYLRLVLIYYCNFVLVASPKDMQAVS